MDPTQFRTDFPEFANTTMFPDSAVTLWLNAAALVVDPCRFGDMASIAQELWAAHNLNLEAKAMQAANAGAVPGDNTGPLAGKSVGPVAMQFDAAVASIEGAGNYNLTTYGTRYLQLVKLFGAGGIQL